MGEGFRAAEPSLIASEVVQVSEPAAGFLRVVIDNPPVNLFDPTVFAGLHLLKDHVDARGEELDLPALYATP